MIVGGEVAPRLADLPVVPDAGRQGEQALVDAHPDSREGVCAVPLQRELALEGVVGRLDPLTDGPQRAVAGFLVAAVGAQQKSIERGDQALELSAGETLVGDDDLTTGEQRALPGTLQQGRGDLALGLVGRRQAEGDRGIPSGATSR